MKRAPTQVRIDVQWGDVDMMQHVNNVLFFKWFETARTRYFEDIDLAGHVPKGVGPILASTRADYRGQLRYPDTIVVECNVTKIGRSSCTQAYRVKSEKQGGKVVTEGEGTWVCFDYQAQKPVPLPRALIAAIEEFEQRTF